MFNYQEVNYSSMAWMVMSSIVLAINSIYPHYVACTRLPLEQCSSYDYDNTNDHFLRALRNSQNQIKRTEVATVDRISPLSVVARAGRAGVRMKL